MLQKPTEGKHPKEAAPLARPPLHSGVAVTAPKAGKPQRLLLRHGVPGSPRPRVPPAFVQGSCPVPNAEGAERQPWTSEGGAVNILIRTRLLLSRKRRSYIMKSHPFNQANEMLYKKKAKTHSWLQPMNCCCLSDSNTSSFVSFEVAGETCRLSCVTTKPPLPSEVAVACTRRLQPFLRVRGKTRGDEQALVRFVLPRWIKSYF